MSELTTEEREALAEPMYDAWRLARFAAHEYLPMWHELDAKPTGTPEHKALYAAVERILAARIAALRADLTARLTSDETVEQVARELRERGGITYLNPSMTRSILAAAAEWNDDAQLTEPGGGR